jgi:hypothetical protein
MLNMDKRPSDIQGQIEADAQKLAGTHSIALYNVFTENSDSSYKAFQAVCVKFCEIIADSKKLRIVRAPDEFDFDADRLSRIDYHTLEDQPKMEQLFWLRRIPKPCPAPVLDPVPVTWQHIYGENLSIPPEYQGWQAVFGLVDVLRDEGFTHFLYDDGLQIATTDSVVGIRLMYRICFRQWSGV